MWLLDVKTFELCFFAVPPPRYAILSHTWAADEVLFGDLQDASQPRHKAGWVKIKFVCDEAKKNGIPYAWVDSCCIDKSSSAELSEAINSMFEWYKKAECCYTYLSDYQDEGEVSPGIIKDKLARCRWFTRGWTLQELIASRTMVLFDRQWAVVGTKDILSSELAEITGIDEQVLQVMDYMFGLPVGTRMSWAAKRQTTRVEDLAYSLLGIFNINMPMLYGEGDKAFLRLQEEILTQHHDVSLFAWRQQEKPGPAFRGMFAQSPAEFVDCSSIVSRSSPFFSGVRFSVANHGLMVDLDDHAGTSPPDSFTLDLECIDTSENPVPKRVGVALKMFGDFYIRAEPHKLAVPETPSHDSAHNSNHRVQSSIESICVKKTFPRSHSDFMQLIFQRKLVLLYRSNLVRVMRRFNLSAGPPRALTSPPEDDIKNFCQFNSIMSSSIGYIQMFRVGFGGADPLWWDTFTLSPGDGIEYSFAVICGIPIKPDAPSEYLLPWFALFCDRDPDDSKRLLASMLLSCAREDAAPGMVRRVDDVMFQLYTDHFGNIIQQRLPTSFVVGNPKDGLLRLGVNRIGGGASLFCADVQYQRIVNR